MTYLLFCVIKICIMTTLINTNISQDNMHWQKHRTQHHISILWFYIILTQARIEELSSGGGGPNFRKINFDKQKQKQKNVKLGAGGASVFILH